MEDNEKDIIQEVTNEEYKWGFTTDIDTETIRKGLDEDIVRLISKKKGEPEWLLEFRLEAFHRHRDLDDHIPVDPGDFPAFPDHALGIGGRRLDFTADGTVDDGGDFRDDLLEIAAFFGNEGRIGRDTANDAHVIYFPYVFDVGCV